MLFNESLKSKLLKNKNLSDKIKVLHLLSMPHHPREVQSVKDITKLCNLNNNLDYYQVINKPYKYTPPEDVIFDNKELITQLSPGAYGCFLAHRNAIKEFINQQDYRWLLIVECDCRIISDPVHLVKKILESTIFLSMTDYKIFTFGGKGNYADITLVNDDVCQINRMIGTQMYLIDKAKSSFYKHIFNHYGWHTIDLWYNQVFEVEKQEFLWREEILTCQYFKDTFSLIK